MKRLIIGAMVLTAVLFSGFAFSGNISLTDRYSWSEYAGWLDFHPNDLGGVTVYDSYLSGYAWAENIGWVKLGVEEGGPYENTDSTDWGINYDSDSEELSGYAWSENVGWIVFRPVGNGGVTINASTGSFDGYAWSENVGWIHFKNEDPYYNVLYLNSGMIVTPTSLTVSENHGTGFFTVALNREPTSDVVIDIFGNGTEEAIVDPNSMIFTSGNWEIARTVTVTGVNDAIIRDDATAIIASVNDGESEDTYDPVTDQTVFVTCIDDDNANFIVSPEEVTVAENGGVGNFIVVLESQPAGAVVFDITSADMAEAMVNPDSLSFTSGNWNTARTVTITGVNDYFDREGDATTITVSVDDVNSDDAYDPLADQTVSVTCIDDDTVGIPLSRTSMTVEENQGVETFTVALGTQPETGVVIDVTCANTSEALVDPDNLSFTSNNWNQAQTVTIIGVNDNMDRNDSTSISVSVNDAASDDSYDLLSDQTVAVTIADDDTAGVTTTPTVLTIDEAGGVSTFIVRIESEPESGVTINMASSNTGEAGIDQTGLTFTPGNWDAPQTVSVICVNDNIDRNDSTNIAVKVNQAASDETYGILADQTVNVAITDDDDAGITLTPTALTVDEAGGASSFTVALESEPESDVTIDVASADTGEAELDLTSLTFTPGDWNAEQTVTVTGVNDDMDSDDATYITASVNDAASDDVYDLLSDQTASVTCVDDEPSISHIPDVEIEEDHSTGEISFLIEDNQSGPEVLTVAAVSDNATLVPNDSANIALGGTGQNRTINITPTDNESGVATIAVTVEDPEGNTTIDSFAVTVTTVNDAPQVSEISNQVIDEDESTEPIAFTVSDIETPPENISIFAESDNPGLVPESGITLGGTGTNRTITITPAENQHGTTTIIVFVEDNGLPEMFVDNGTIINEKKDDSSEPVNRSFQNGAVGVATETFLLTVRSVNDLPTISDIPDQIIPEGGTTGALSFVVNDIETEPAELIVSAVSDDQILIPDAVIEHGGSGETRIITATPEEGLIGSATITVTVMDADDGFRSDEFVLTIIPMNLIETQGNTRLMENSNPDQEDMETDSYTIALTRQPGSDVTVLLTVTGPDGQILVTGDVESTERNENLQINFTPDDWDVPREVILTVVNDIVLEEEEQTITISHVLSSSDSVFDGVRPNDVIVTVLDNDADIFADWWVVDFNNDRWVDSIDLTILLYAYGSQVGDIHWNPVCDIGTEANYDLIENDGQISFADLVKIAFFYGQHESGTPPGESEPKFEDALTNTEELQEITSKNNEFENANEIRALIKEASDFTLDTYTITTNTGPGGVITPTGCLTANKGASRTFAITRDSGFNIFDILIDGESAGLVASYAFENLSADHTIEAVFIATDAPPANHPVPGKATETKKNTGGAKGGGSCFIDALISFAGLY